MFLGWYEGPDSQPDRSLPVDVEILDLLPQSSSLALQALQASRVVPSYFYKTRKTLKNANFSPKNSKFNLKKPSPNEMLR